MKTKFNGILTLILALFVQVAFAQTETIQGTVTDDTGMPLPGVNIVIKGTSTGVQTDFDGNYAIEATEGDILVFSFLSLKTAEHIVGEANTINVVMEPDVAILDAVVVTALGIKRKEDAIATAYDVVDSEELTRANNPNVVNALTGKVSGLQIKQTSNGVTGENRIILRGNRSISGNNEALIVIDGAISNASYLASINPNMVESTNVIKGPAGAALYGSQGSNGVIIVTTKKGAEGEKMKVTTTSVLDFESVAFVPERQTRYGQGWALGNGFEHLTYENGGWGPEFDGQMAIVGLPQADGSYIMAPWSSRGAYHIKDFFETGTTLQNSVTIASGDEESYATFSARNRQTDFVIENDKLTNSSFTFNAGKTLGNWTIGGNATYSYTATEESYASTATEGIYMMLLQTASNIPIERFENSGNEGHWNAYYMNPYWVRDNRRRERDVNRFNLLADVGYKINDNISASIKTNGIFTFVDNLQYENEYAEPTYVTDLTGSDRSAPSTFRFYTTHYQRYYTDAMVNFDYMLSDDISFQALIGGNNQYEKNTVSSVGGTGLTIPGLYTASNLESGFDNAVTYDDRSTVRRVGVFANVDLGYKDFLFLNITGRNDWTSTLNPENNSFFYPGAGLSFIATKAIPGLKSDILNYMKASVAYVQVGNDGGIPAYATQEVYVQAPGFPYEGINSFVSPTTVYDPMLEPEFTTNMEVGLNFGFFNDRITLDLAYYNFSTENQITRIGASAASGLSGSYVNLGETEGYGGEIDLGITPIKTDDLRWDVNFGYSKSYTEVVKVTDQSDAVSLGGYTGYAEIFAEVGQQFPIIKGTGFERDPQGRILINPTSGMPVQATGLVNLGNTTPDYILNLSSSISYKGFTLAATMDYRTGHVFFSDAKSQMMWSGHLVESAQGGRGAFIFPNSAIETSEGVYEANTNVPTGGTTAAEYVNFWGAMRNLGETSVIDATAFKVRELSLRYDLNPKLLENTFLTGLTISANARNPFTVLPAENRGYADPESNFTTTNAQGIATVGQYPPTRTFGVGVNLTF
ncbi:MAG TPA: SusC/RagA family TonB-linked outer membrane protein [Salinimicrobium sp.]|nr:SusC/RagA family TonB-linked outer membrane protein [Salinimicrobium sp.]